MKRTRNRKLTRQPWHDVYDQIVRKHEKKGDEEGAGVVDERAGPRAFGYFRVSTHRQESEGYSLDAQKARILKYAEDRNLGEVLFFAETAVSATKVPMAKRLAGRMLIERLRPGDHLIITRIDRAFRSFSDFVRWQEQWMKDGITLHVVDFGGTTMDSGTAIGRYMARQLALVATLEGDFNGERTRAAAEAKRAQGYLYTSRAVPRGFKAVKQGKGWIAVPDPHARRLMAQMTAWNDDGWSFQAIADHLKDQNVPALRKHQRGWNHWNVWKTIDAERKLQAAERKDKAKA